jgi:BASS family bile acid:Na+ symporter
MGIDKLINILVTVTLFEMMVSTGLGVTFAEIAAVARNGVLVLRAVLANYVFVPAIVVALLILFRAHPMVRAGFLLAAVCPGAPYGPPLTAIAKGNVGTSVGLMVILAGSSAIIAPLLIHWLLPLMLGNATSKVDDGKMIGTLLVSQFIPLCVGIALNQLRPDLAGYLKKPAKLLSAILNLSVFGLIIAVQFRMLAEIHLAGCIGMFILVIATLAAGWVMAGPGNTNRKAMTLTTATRNVGVSLVIATASFPGTQAITAVLAYAIFQTIIVAFVAFGWGRLSPLEIVFTRSKAA